MAIVIQFSAGLLFGLGLLLAGMSDPAKVLNFLDVAAIGTTWDGSLAFVLAGAILVTLVGYRLAWRSGRPWFGARFALPSATRIDRRLVGGSVLFGMGWGIAGFCPGPAITALGTGSLEAGLFVLAMLGGMMAARMLAEARGAGAASPRTA